ncbi:MAG: hypothetical protein U1E65_03685 [Myxococcota bacterium]
MASPPELREALIVGPWADPSASDGYLNAATLSSRLSSYSESEILEGLHGLAADGLIVLHSDDAAHGAMFHATESLWREREEHLHRMGCRHPALVGRRRNNLEHLVVAVIMAGQIQNRRIVGPFFAASTCMPLPILAIYLLRFEVSEVEAAVQRLLDAKLLREEEVQLRRTRTRGFDLDVRTAPHYENVVRPELELSPSESILDVSERSFINVFWAWQSDYKPSRSQGGEALSRLEERANRDWLLVAPLRVVTAVELGDGSVRIDQELLDKIKQADFFVGDVTPVVRYDNRLSPNANVLIEVGYALASKAPTEVFLVERRRPQEEIPGPGQPNAEFPFDIRNVHRLVFDAPADLFKRLFSEMRVRLEAKGLLRGDQKPPEPRS